MTTIGTAVLQIIPSLKGVSEAIEKQIDGKVVEVKIAPKVDQAAAKKAGKDAGDTIAKEAKDAVSKGEIGKAVAEDVKTGVKKSNVGKDVATTLADDVKKSSPGKDIAKVIVEGLADGVKQGLPAGSFGGAIVDGLTDQVNKGIESSSLGADVVGSITRVIKSGNLAGAIKDSVLPGITEIGTQLSSAASQWSHGIAASLRSGDITGATTDIATSVQSASNTIAGIGDVLGVKTGGVKSIGDDLSAALKKIGDTAGDTHTQVDGVITPLKSFGDLAGPDSKLFKATSKLPLIGQLVELVPVMRDANSQLESIVQKYTGLNVPLSGESWLRFLMKSDVNDALQKKLGDAQAAAAANAAPVQRGNAVPGDTYRGPGRAGGGPISGPGGPTSDVIPIWASNGEYVVKAAAARQNMPLLEAINSGRMPRFAGGGQVGPDVNAAKKLVGTPYSQGSRFDCSGTVARVINAALGIPDGGLMTTKTAAEWLSARGFKSGTGGPGAISVGWYDHGPNPNDGHMAMTLSDGENAESGGKNSKFTVGAGASGANSPQFDHHMFLSIANAVAPLAAAAGDATAPISGEGPPTSGSGGGGPLPASISGLSSFGLNGLGAGVGTTGSGSDLSKFGNAAGSAVTGQVSSALGVLGVNDSPGWLKAASMLVGGLKVGGHDPSGASDGSIFNGANPLGSFGSAAPASATPISTGAPPPAGSAASGNGLGQAPGPVFNTTIQARDAEGALEQWQRWQKQRVAAKLDSRG